MVDRSEFDSRYGQEFSFFHIVQTSSVAHLISNLYRWLFLVGKAAEA
jgi:hypothetical protein